MYNTLITMEACEVLKESSNNDMFWLHFDEDRKGNYWMYATTINHEITLSYSIDDINKIVTIKITNEDSTNPFNDSNNILHFSPQIHNSPRMRDMNFFMNVKGVANFELMGCLLNCNLTTDAQILSTSDNNVQYGFTLDAPNLRELTTNIETSKIMKLSDETPKDFKLTTVGKEGYLHDPYYEDDSDAFDPPLPSDLISNW
jgi:hypothetical protein